MPGIEPARRQRFGSPSKPAKPGTPIRNGLLLMIFAALLGLLVILLPKEPTGVSALGGAGGENAGADEAPTLRLSEVMSANKSAYPDESGQYADWVEIENFGEEPVSLEGVGLSDRDNNVKFIFPDQTLEPGGFLLVFCDSTNASAKGAPLHARFGIAAAGETIYLFDPFGYVLDQAEAPAMGADLSYVRAGDDWMLTEQYTPGYPNTEAGYDAFRSAAVGAASGLVINELCASNRTSVTDEDGEYSDWIELYNGGSRPIDLSNYALSNDVTQPIRWRFPQGAVIEPGGYYLVFASKKNRPGGDGLHPHASFGLAAEGRTVTLSDVLGHIIDRTSYENLGTDVSWGRVEGLPNTWQVYAEPTPGEPNTRAGAAAIDARIRARNQSGVFISEVVTSSTGVETPYGSTSFDWIELVNLGTEPVNLKDWGLSDRVERPRKWQFSDVTIGPGEYLLVFPSGYSESPTGSDAIHATFRLSALGETLVLSDPTGKILDRLAVPKLEVNNSYGRDFDQGGLFYYETPTAAGVNTAQGFAGYAASPTILGTGGIYVRPVTVELSAPEGVHIRYTTDGSLPTETIGQDYTGPIEIREATVLRARGFMQGLKPSAAVTESFLVNVYHSLPVISLTVDPDDLWNPLTGIYADGEDETFERPQFKQTTYYRMKEDRAMRERAANFELFTPEGAQLLNQGVAVQLHGNFSMDMAQKTFRITAKAKYGATSLAYPFFDDRPYDEYHSIILRSGGTEDPYTRLVDVLAAKMVDWTDSTLLTMASTPAIVYLNGEYWGQYFIRERIDDDYVAMAEGWPNPDAMDLIKADRQALTGSYNNNYKPLLDYVKKHDLNDPAALETVLNWIDVDNYFDFMIFETYFGNTDTLNIKFYRQRGEGGKWRWIFFDIDWGFFYRNTKGFNAWLKPEGTGDKLGDNTLIRALLAVPEMRDRFLTRYGELFQEYLSDTDRILAQIDELVAEIDPEMGLHFSRWAGQTRKTVAFDPPSDPEGAYNYWKSRINRLKNIVRGRPYHVWTQALEWFSLSEAEMIAYFGPCPEETTDIY